MATKGVKAVEGGGKSSQAKAGTNVERKSSRSNKTSASSTIKTKDSDQFPLVLHADITLPPRPIDGEEGSVEQFYNPRPLDEVLNPEALGKLVFSIRLDGLMENPVVNFVTDPLDNDCLIKVELLAGERRYHAIKQIRDLDLWCVDEDGKKPKTFKEGDVINWTARFGTVVKQEGDVITATFEDASTPPKLETLQCPYAAVLPTRSGRKAYEYIPCKVYNDLPNDRKMRISFSENDNSEPLSVKAEVTLVERLLKTMKQQEVAYMLNSNITFVSQRSSFRTQLPAEAFATLMEGKMAANLAVNMLSYKAEDRVAYFERMQEVCRCAYLNNVAKHRSAKERYEDEADEHETNAKRAEKSGDTATAAKERKKAVSAAGKAKKHAERLNRTEAEKDHLKQGHGHKAAAELGITPRTKKMLVKEQVEQLYIKGMAKYVTGNVADPITGHYIPDAHAAIVRRTAKAIFDGVLDPLSIVRDYMIETGEWELPSTTKAGATTKPLPQPKKGKSVKDDDEEIEPDESAFEQDDEDDEEIEPDESAFEQDDEDDFDDDDDDDDDNDDKPRGRRRNEDDEDFEDDGPDWGNSDSFDRDWN